MESTSNKLEEEKDVKESNKGFVCVVVLGDIGRSPRMNYHSLSLAKEGYAVHLIGYGSETTIPAHLHKNNRISIHSMPQPPNILQSVPRLLCYPLKVAWQILFLSWAFVWMILCHQFRPDFILLQNPPAIPTLPISYLFSIVLWADLILDWHNYAHSLMAIQHGGHRRWIVRLSKWIEDYFGAKAHKHICVTNAMRKDLQTRLNIQAVTLYDRPPSFFKPLQDEEKREFLCKLREEYSGISEVVDNWLDDKKRPGILISSTSWTEDEDFNILLNALIHYESLRNERKDVYRKLLVFITGKGPLKEHYLSKIRNIAFSSVKIYTPWLEQEDYPKLLGCGDLGISLHYSSSGLDLPMKVVDMFGVGLPVAAAHFQAIGELVKDGENGMVFHDAKELGTQIQDWFKITPNTKHKKFRENLKSFQAIRWHQNWIQNAYPLFT